MNEKEEELNKLIEKENKENSNLGFSTFEEHQMYFSGLNLGFNKGWELGEKQAIYGIQQMILDVLQTHRSSNDIEFHSDIIELFNKLRDMTLND